MVAYCKYNNNNHLYADTEWDYSFTFRVCLSFLEVFFANLQWFRSSSFHLCLCDCLYACLCLSPFLSFIFFLAYCWYLYVLQLIFFLQLLFSYSTQLVSTFNGNRHLNGCCYKYRLSNNLDEHSERRRGK